MFYAENKDNTDSVVIKLVDELFKSKYDLTTFYCHNLGGFHVVFMLKILVDYNVVNSEQYKFEVKHRDNSILSITIHKGKNKVTIRDSLVMFNSSLSSLAKSYECHYQKSYFPFKFASLDNLSYVGATPCTSYYENISNEDYKLLVKNE